MAESGSLTVYPNSLYDSSNMTISNTDRFIGKGTTNSEYCSCALIKGNNTVAWVSWSFDLSAVPEGAEIKNVTCEVKHQLSATSYIDYTNTFAQLYSGATAKGATVSIWNSTQIIATISNTGTWTRDELQSCLLRLQVKRESSGGSNSRTLYLFGADLTVTYTYQSEKFMLKLGGAYNDIARVFKKVNGIWVEQTDLANVIEDGVRYQNGGEIISPKKTVTITGSGDTNHSYVTINGVKYIGEATLQVDAGTVITAHVSTNTAGGIPKVYVDGSVVLDTGGDYRHTVNESCTVELKYASGYNFGTITITTGDGSSANLISFTIDGTSYQAEEGMTWEKWIESGYNTGSYYGDETDCVVKDTGDEGVYYMVFDSAGIAQVIDYIIVANETYTY